ncbi:MAG: ArsB/NhaD family transporter [Selenomonadales bacterium]|nr:ArsB/NhaD family transporter [Selenomonadales bacterium]
MENNALLAVVVFLATYIFIISEKIHRTVIALVGGMIVVVLGVISQETAIHHIDFNTLGLLVGMMIIVGITAETGLFNYLAIKAAKKVEGKPTQVMLVMSILTAVCSALLDNVTTVLLTVPVTLSIANKLKVPAVPFLVSQILASNIGGTATLIGDPPNIMIGSSTNLGFGDFVMNLAPISIVIFIVTVILLELIYKKRLVTTDELRAHIMTLDESKEIKDKALLKKSVTMLAITIVLFALHQMLHLESATVAMFCASILLLIAYPSHEKQLEAVFRKVEWVAIFFFVGLFILVGSLVETGVISTIAQEAMEITKGDTESTAILILWLSAIASAFVDNIPFVATMIPMIHEMGRMGMENLGALWWSLALGACLGGNGTLIGASANVVVAGIAAAAGQPISFVRFFKIAFPLMIISIILSHVYIYLRYL